MGTLWRENPEIVIAALIAILIIIKSRRKRFEASILPSDRLDGINRTFIDYRGGYARVVEKCPVYE